MSDQNARMGDDYYRYPVGGVEHYAAYKKAFEAARGDGFTVPDDPWESYEIDNAYELAALREPEEDDLSSYPGSGMVAGPGIPSADHGDAEPDMEPG
jgi:hypothetical protein